VRGGHCRRGEAFAKTDREITRIVARECFAPTTLLRPDHIASPRPHCFAPTTLLRPDHIASPRPHRGLVASTHHMLRRGPVRSTQGRQRSRVDRLLAAPQRRKPPLATAFAVWAVIGCQRRPKTLVVFHQQYIEHCHALHALPYTDGTVRVKHVGALCDAGARASWPAFELFRSARGNASACGCHGCHNDMVRVTAHYCCSGSRMLSSVFSSNGLRPARSSAIQCW